MRAGRVINSVGRWRSDDGRMGMRNIDWVKDGLGLSQLLIIDWRRMVFDFLVSIPLRNA